MQSGAILLIPSHPPRRPYELHPGRLRTPQEARLALDHLRRTLSLPAATLPVQTADVVMVQRDSPALSLSFRALHVPLDPGDEVEVAVEGRRGGELAAAQVGGRVAHARALRPFLMSLRADQGAGASETAWTAILGDVDVARR